MKYLALLIALIIGFSVNAQSKVSLKRQSPTTRQQTSPAARQTSPAASQTSPAARQTSPAARQITPPAEKHQSTHIVKTVPAHSISFREFKNEIVVEEKKPVEVKKERKVFKSVEKMPVFPGGQGALMMYLSSHIEYPTMAQENNIEGKVIVRFVVSETGDVDEVKVARSVDKDLDREAVRVCKSLPKFIPGRQGGQPVAVLYTLPVTFKLQH